MGTDRRVRCSPQAVAQANKLLDDEAKHILKDDLKFDNMLEVDLETLKRRDIVKAIYNNTEVVDGKIVTHIDDKNIEVTIKRIEEILGLPRGQEEERLILPTSAPNQVCDLFLKHPDVLKKDISKPTLKKMLIGATELLALMKLIDSKMKVRCFLMILLNRILIPASGFHLNDKQAQLAWDLDCVAKIDWCKQVFEHLSDCIKNKHKDNTFSGCSLVLLIAVFEALVPFECPKTQPSVVGYDNAKLKHLLDLIKGKVGVKKERGIDVAIDVSTEQNKSFLQSEVEIHAIMKEMADHLNDVKPMLPEQKRESIQCTLETFDALRLRIWPLDLWDPFYEANVLKVDNDSHGSDTMVQIGDHMITKATFSQSFD